MSTANNPEALFNDISDFVSQSNELLKKGAVMELAGLDDRVQGLCEAVLKLSQDERIRYADHLQRLFADLEQLGKALVEQRDSLAADIRNLSDHRKASSAYRNSSVSGEDKKD